MRSTSCLAADNPALSRLPPRCPSTTPISDRLPLSVCHTDRNIKQPPAASSEPVFMPRRDQHRDVVRGWQQDRHEGIALGELLTGADIDNRLTLAAPRLGVHDIVLTNHESRAAVARAQWVVR
jgi:hypothetical protein